jgi:predicted CopG family antitoxin
MVQKTISLTPETYIRLKMKKKPNESFSELVDRLLGNKKDTTENEDFKSFAGVLAADDEWDTIENILETARQIPRNTLDSLNMEQI